MKHIDLNFQTLSVKQAIERGDYSERDCATLKSLFLQGWLYQRVSATPVLCEAGAKRASVDYAKLVMGTVPPADLGASLDLSLRLAPRAAYSQQDRLPAAVAPAAQAILGEFLADFVSDFHGAISVLSKLSGEVEKDAKEHVLYVIGMAEITAQNFAHIAQECENLDEAAIGRIEQFAAAAITFAAALKVNLASLMGSTQRGAQK